MVYVNKAKHGHFLAVLPTFWELQGEFALARCKSGAHMPNGQPVGRAGKNVFAHGQNWAGLCNGTSFKAGPGSPKKFGHYVRSGWTAHFLMGFTYVSSVMGYVLYRATHLLRRYTNSNCCSKLSSIPVQFKLDFS